MPIGKLTERSFYPTLMKIINSEGGTGVQEVSFNSVPDIVFELGKIKWILSVKIGEDIKTIKDAFLQYLRHKEESKIVHGVLLLLPESVRTIHPQEEAINVAIKKLKVSAFIDADLVKEERRDLTFSELIHYLQKQIIYRLVKKQSSYYTLRSVIKLLQQQVSETMRAIPLDQNTILKIITDKELLMDLGHLKQNQAESVARFLASYLLLSQILFLRLFYSKHIDIFSEPFKPISHYKLRKAFSKILEKNYKPIYRVDVLDSIPENYLHDTFDLIWGLEIEKVQTELPGRIFHELMPPEIRKMMAAFYTRPMAADLLARLTISKSDATVFDPACGSGTILISAYKAKFINFKKEKLTGNPHKRFCENEIFGADIMPFSVHLTCANLSAMDVSTTLDRTQIIQGDSLKLGLGKVYPNGIQLEMFNQAPLAKTTSGEIYGVALDKIDVVLMNPPFTKVERGIKHFVDMTRFKEKCGGEVGLWGHFIALADNFLKEEGIYGAVLPINVLRGRESEKVREILFKEWTPLYIVKATRNFGFSEGSAYRDVLFIAKKQSPKPSHKVKFCLIKKEFGKLNDLGVARIASQIRRKSFLRSKDLDIDSHKLSIVNKRFANLMWFCGVTDLDHRKVIIKFLSKFEDKFDAFPQGYFKEGFRPVPKGVSEFLFLTRHSEDPRIEQAFLSFENESDNYIKAKSPLGAFYQIEKSALIPTLRTPVGLKKMDISKDFDYIATKPYNELERVCHACGFQIDKIADWPEYWANIYQELERIKTSVVISHRINPFSAYSYLTAFYSEKEISASNQMNVILEKNRKVAQAICVILNSSIFFSQFFMLKEESTGTYINIRFYDLYQMKLYPKRKYINDLVKIYQKFKNRSFPALRNQFDYNFDERYMEFWKKEEGISEAKLFGNILDKDIEPSPDRLEFDLEICGALGIRIDRKELLNLYHIFVKEMIITRHLIKE